MHERVNQWLMLVGFVAVCFAAAGFGGYFTAQSVGGWYQTLRRPDWNPPDWLFGPVWTVLYVMMGVAAWLVLRKVGLTGAGWALVVFGVQLVLNALWSLFFFGLRNPLAGVVEITLLWCAIWATVVLFWRITPLASLLLWPYLAWVTFAMILNAAIWRLNG